MGGCLHLREGRGARVFSWLRQAAVRKVLLPEEERFLLERTLLLVRPSVGTACFGDKLFDNACTQLGNCARNGLSKREMECHPSSHCERLCIVRRGEGNGLKGWRQSDSFGGKCGSLGSFASSEALANCLFGRQDRCRGPRVGEKFPCRERSRGCFFHMLRVRCARLGVSEAILRAPLGILLAPKSPSRTFPIVLSSFHELHMSAG